MTTIRFKRDEDEARQVREAARRSRLTLLEFIRRRLIDDGETPAISPVRCPETGVEIFAPASHLPPLNGGSVREILADFP